MSRYNSNNGWILLAGIVAVIAWVIMRSDDKETDLERQVQGLADEVGAGMASIYAFLADQMNPSVHADPAPESCTGGTCFPDDQFNINLTGFTQPDKSLPVGLGDYQSAYQGGLSPGATQQTASLVDQLSF